jgi:predicted ribosomally synthesized peptide with nif11-like leader
MSEANLHQFLAKAVNDSAIQDQLKNVADRATFSETAVRLGRQQGFDFTAADVDAALFQSKENPLDQLSDQDLELVAGGMTASRPKATSDGCGSAWTTLFGWCS